MELRLYMLQAEAAAAVPAERDGVDQGVDLLLAGAKGAHAILRCEFQEHLVQVVAVCGCRHLLLASLLGLLHLGLRGLYLSLPLGGLLLLAALPLRMQLREHRIGLRGRLGCRLLWLCRRRCCLGAAVRRQVHRYPAAPLLAAAGELELMAVQPCQPLQDLKLLVCGRLPLGGRLLRSQRGNQRASAALEGLKRRLLLSVALLRLHERPEAGLRLLGGSLPLRRWSATGSGSVSGSVRAPPRDRLLGAAGGTDQ
mmetsp:Transcript_16525/g.49895  ORF Transcript_16525/g.49895 Transcript_16525/m.49895 type:complete len:254 (-) Transcript_16525:641-1402(-)